MMSFWNKKSELENILRSTSLIEVSKAMTLFWNKKFTQENTLKSASLIELTKAMMSFWNKKSELENIFTVNISHWDVQSYDVILG